MGAERETKVAGVRPGILVAVALALGVSAAAVLWMRVPPAGSAPPESGATVSVHAALPGPAGEALASARRPLAASADPAPERAQSGSAAAPAAGGRFAAPTQLVPVGGSPERADAGLHELAPEARAAFARGREAEGRGDREAALEAYLEAASKDPDNAEPLLAAARVARSANDPARAEALLQQAVVLEENAFGVDHPRVADALNQLASIYVQEQRFDEAEPLYLRALAIEEGTFGYRHPQVAGALGALGFLYQEQGRYDEARTAFESALALDEDTLGRTHPNVAARLSALGNLLAESESYDAAVPLLQQAVAIRELMLGEDHPHTVATLGGLSNLYLEVGRVEDALPLLERILIAREAQLGEDHPRVAWDVAALGVAHIELGNFQEARVLSGRVLDLESTGVAAGGVSRFARRLNELTARAWAEGRHSDAEAIYDWSLDLLEERFGPDDPNGVFFREQEAAREAQALRGGS